MAFKHVRDFQLSASTCTLKANLGGYIVLCSLVSCTPPHFSGDASVESEKDNTEDDEYGTRDFEGIIQGALSEFLSDYEDFHIPALPPINIDGDEQYR